MTLYLDHIQRINLYFLMGAQRGTVDDVRLWWRLQDTIALDDGEKQAIGYRMGKVGESEQPVWDFTKSLPAREFELKDEEFKRVEKVIREWQAGYLAGSDRRWLEPLLAQFDESQKVNGRASDDLQRLPGGLVAGTNPGR